mmetsp:Transcript_20452/g.29159  ORF Transcript_20452/g.29159 Transcript_20452/m.29159 type:complete len:389 (+) Transcript_20452:105-1271(+)|eukprot:CAMPEP_0172414550 /NCGR_PEP_ID=MMETSP1064-20121228/1203_1 /TAXON_ID=202472 /ORGANISM="Aulacoseira subarctica , Strain CCAP 1002/5" /LENGTH=388 /DNA_ID=CAMNT_0013151277 /DNA_START=135 /DNA_END=1301 /DNA_ORIENTATION=-
MGNAPPNASSQSTPSQSYSSHSNKQQQQQQHPNVHNAPPNVQNSASGYHNPYAAYSTAPQQQQQQQQHPQQQGYNSTAQQQQMRSHYMQQQPQQHRRSTSDSSMADVGNETVVGSSSAAHYHHSLNSLTANNSHHVGSTTNTNMPKSYVEEEDMVPTVFRWEHGGRQVYITGTFNDWSRQIPMHRSGNDFTYIHNLRKGKHAFKFIVDDEWRFAPDQPTVADIEGRINNFIDVSDFKPYTGDRHFEDHLLDGTSSSIYTTTTTTTTITAEGGGGPPNSSTADEDQTKETTVNTTTTSVAIDKEEDLFQQTMPDLDEYTKEPPPLPPHLRHIILNKAPSLTDTAALPVPQHVALNHLYCTAIKDNMMVLGVTQRYKTKFVTTVYYSPCE